MAEHRIFVNERAEYSLTRKLTEINWVFAAVICAIAATGFLMLYSVAGGELRPWALRQIIRFCFGMMLFVAIAVVHIEHWFRMAYLLYFLALALVVAVEILGQMGMGAQRWINLGLFQVQPSEIMKITLVLGLARYFHGIDLGHVTRLRTLVVPGIMIAAPVALVMGQPDLGTALLMTLGGAFIFFLAGVRLRVFGAAVAMAVAAIPIGWQFLRDYQKDRVLTFLNPENDPLGAGYHILQSKIALGSGGIGGKGFMQGTQSHLHFLPEKHTDFIFTMLAEEFGITGGLLLLGLYVIVLIYGFAFALQARNQFGRLTVLGITSTFFLYLFMNIAMVMGLVPVVGVPLPLVSYGGTSMLTLLIGFGLVMSVHIHRDVTISKAGIVR
ncbi:MAG: rod shape-determining protein RodA [Sphingomonadales bacterium]